jgi:hypothetical protein
MTSTEQLYFFTEQNRNFLDEKWSIAIQFPDDKILINQISARIELARFVDTFTILDDNNPSDYLIPKQIDDLKKIINLLEIIQKCNNQTIHHNYKIYLDYLFSSVVYSKCDYESRYSKEIEIKILNSIDIKKKKRIFRKIISLGFA